MEFILEIIIEVVFRSILGFFQTLAGLFTPTTQQAYVARKRLLGLVALASLGTLCLGIVFIAIFANHPLGTGLIVLAIVLIVFSGLMGRNIEKSIRRDHKN